MTGWSVGFLIAIFWVCAAAAAPLAGRLMDRYGRRSGLGAGHLLAVVALFLLLVPASLLLPLREPAQGRWDAAAMSGASPRGGVA